MSLPLRGPRVMNGMAAILAKARALSPVKATVDAQNEHSARMADLATLVQRCKDAERKVARVQQVLTAFEGQQQQLPDGHPARQLSEQMLSTFRLALQ